MSLDGRHPDTVILGAGPAGLSAAAALSVVGRSTVVVEQGKPQIARSTSSPRDLIAGVGGAGLFADGKFSFYPSASELWRIRPSWALRDAYEWCGALLRKNGLDAPPFPDLSSSSDRDQPEAIKRYPSLKASDKVRRSIVNEIVREYTGPIMMAKAVHICLNPLEIRIRGSSYESILRPNNLIIATGRFGPLLMQSSWSAADLRYRRVELGVRIEQPSEVFFLRNETGLDPKWIQKANGREWRTFCCCRGGEVVTTRDEIASVSGRTEESAGRHSNIGFLVRLLDAGQGLSEWKQVRERLELDPAQENLASFRNNVTNRTSSPLIERLGPRISESLADGFGFLEEAFGPLVAATLHGPCVEGIGEYPAISEKTLQHPNCRMWCAGDATGLFRGLLAAMVSGYFVGMRASCWEGPE